MGYFSDIYNGIKTLLTGMSVTGKYFINARKEIITQEFPNNRDTLKMFDRFRGEVVMPHDENNEHRCTGCQKCELACPNGSIEIIWDRVIDEETGKKIKAIDKHIYHLSMCTMCGLCIEACPTDAIKWSQNFSNSAYDRTVLTKVLNKPGSKIMPGVKDKE
ncbi:MAG: 4Fe-4S binding protein [Bacteroidetes bacterium]|jgi:NADH-quinone oxidoreductase subunit I|nr:4Fe-4S binding protein [Bacteroidota bacterium]